MAKKKGSHSSSSTKDDKTNGTTKAKNNEKSKDNKEETPASTTTGGIPLWICVLVGLLCLILGVLTPHLLNPPKSVSDRVAIQNRKLAEAAAKAKQKSKRHNKMNGQTQNSNPPVEYPCNENALQNVLHQKPVQGMHVVCMNQTMASLQLTVYPGAQQKQIPTTVELEGLPTWDHYKQVLIQQLSLESNDDLEQPWAIYSVDGELLCRETDSHVQMEGLVQMGMALVFKGGQFIWPGVRIGFQRTIDLYSTMPQGSPDMQGKHRQATLETLSLEPLVFAVEGFLDPDECDFFQQEAAPTMKYSQVTLMDMDKGRPASDFRTSQSTFLGNNHHPTVKDIDYRTASLVRVPRFHQESVQVLRYGGGEKYDAHHDYFDKRLYQNDPSTLKNFIQYGKRNRMITVFWYLSDVEEGGETVFPRFGGAPPPRNMSSCDDGLKVKPTRGKVIIFYSLKADGSLDPLSLHGACPVKKGIKWAANKWVWNAPIEFGSGR